MLEFLSRGATSDLAEGVAGPRIRDAAARELFALLGDPPKPDRDLEDVARRLLREHLARVTRAEVDATCCIPGAASNISCLGALEDVQTELERHGTLHTWGHFIATPHAHAEAVATFTASDGVARVYMATTWRA